MWAFPHKTLPSVTGQLDISHEEKDMYRLWKTKAGKWKWEVRAGNHVVMLRSSQAHPSKDKAQAEIKKVWRWAGTHYKPMNSCRYIERHEPQGYRGESHQFVVLERDKPIAKSKIYKTDETAHIGAALAVELCKSNETLLLSPKP